MNPGTNQFEPLSDIFKTSESSEVGPEISGQLDALQRQLAGGPLIRPDGSPVPRHWTVLTVGENVVIKDYTFKVAYINDGTLVLEPVGVPVLDAGKEKSE